MTPFQKALDDISIDRIKSHIQSIEGIRHPVTAPEALQQSADYILKTLISLGYDMSDHCFNDGGSSFSNVIATRRGTLYPDQRVIVMAHFDTVSTSPGADDNASGVALLLELATIFKEARFEKSIQFIGVNLEECSEEGCHGKGTRGSRALAKFAREQGWDIEGVVVLESVAYAGASYGQLIPPGIPIETPEAGDFIAVIGNDSSTGMVQKFCAAVDRHGIPLPCLPLVVPGNGEVFPDTRRSDHAPFWDQGYKAIMLTDTTNFRNPHYHTPTDTLETLNLVFAREVCRATGALVMDLAGGQTELVGGQPL